MSESKLGEQTSNTLPEISEAEYEEIVNQIKACALEFAKNHNAQDWLLNLLKRARFLEEIVAELRYFKGGQIAVLEKLRELKPDLIWYRGGTLRSWRESSLNSQYFSENDLETLVIDGGANGILGKPDVAIGFLTLAHRQEPVLYSLPISALIEGLKTDAIRLVTEHRYDLRVLESNNRLAYLEFCRKHLDINSAGII